MMALIVAGDGFDDGELQYIVSEGRACIQYSVNGSLAGNRLQFLLSNTAQ